ncbi:glycerate kinase [Schizosaccharomyces cryophilus OY26]|uniref:Glycerate kinase n=1 Tax=Schizosaccharomyces cryophilus (strain OY26 / ATCC MYA-4695 / CBS 11777 / NBRC 106824 / NRRL Y48691) TaxID=653667 RepID=S9X9H9_SCHCR|nr:glycerate kinase [Schizosaccharomyces cryophilus OY26]EPY50376.1 glycerate kinase [Schizosaccharomyces cryophilus OY26]
MSSLNVVIQKVVQFYEKQSKPEGRPFILGISGPQGSGKSTLALTLKEAMERKKGKVVVNISLDDFYLTHEEQVALGKSHPDNPLIQHRGLAGTHDVELMNSVIDSFRNPTDTPIEIPFYDKSKYNGYGDRADKSRWQVVSPKEVDLVLFEGWMVGFEPMDPCMLSVRARSTKWQSLEDSLLWVNEQLARYQPVFEKIDSLVQLEAQEIKYVYAWRLQQEHTLKTLIRTGMSDEEVEMFVNNYMPQYILYLGTLSNKVHLSHRCLEIVLDENRWPVVIH